MYFSVRDVARVFSDAPLLKYMTLFHAHEPNFSANCTIDNGTGKFTGPSSQLMHINYIKLHLYQVHRNFMICSKNKIQNQTDFQQNCAKILC